jgi:predicted lactoylglutathione lyase
MFCDGPASCMVFSETIFAMLLSHARFSGFTTKPIANARETGEVLLCLSADGRPKRERESLGG